MKKVLLRTASILSILSMLLFCTSGFTYPVFIHSHFFTASITASGTTQFCPGSSVTLTASAGQSYAWSNGATSQSILVNQSGIYSVTITSNGISETAAPVTVTVSDTEVPIITAPADLQVGTDSYDNAATHIFLGTPATSDNCGIVSVTNNAPLRFPIGKTSVVWMVTDKSGNSSTAIQTVTVTDTEKPSIYRMGEISVVNDPGKCGAVVQLFTPYAWDNSGGPVAITNNAPAYFTVGSQLITWTATDIYGNSDTSTQLITVIDNELPTITTPADIRVGNDAGKCGATIHLSQPETSDNCGVVIVTNDAPAFFPTGTTLVHWKVTDKVGYSASTTQTVMVTDDEKPVVIPSAAITVTSDPLIGGAIVALGTARATDNCEVASITNDAPALFLVGTTTVSWTATDINGNSATAFQSVIVLDPTVVVKVKDISAPVFSNVPANVSVSCDNIPAAATPLVKDDTDPNPTISFTQISTKGINPSNSAFYNYTITRTWTAKDASGNISAAKQLITVADKTAPVLTVPANIITTNDLNVCGAVIKYLVSATDNCNSPVTITCSKKSGTVFATGITTVTVTAKDVTGNYVSQSFTVAVTDNQKPTLTVPKNISVAVANSGSKINNLNLGTPVTGDNCGVKSITNNAPAAFSVGTTLVTWIVKDAGGNTTTGIQTVTVTVMAGTPVKKNVTVNGLSLAGAVTVETSNENNTLTVFAAPNPSRTYFTLKLNGNTNQPVELRVADAFGRVVDTRSKLAANSTLQIGENYLPGVYFAELIQGKEHKVVQLLKVN
jgi:hypothetical protein